MREALATTPTRPAASRNATSCSPGSFRRMGAQSGPGSSVERSAGIRYWRMRLPIGAPGPTRVISALSSLLSMAPPPREVTATSPLRNMYRASGCAVQPSRGSGHAAVTAPAGG